MRSSVRAPCGQFMGQFSEAPGRKRPHHTYHKSAQLSSSFHLRASIGARGRTTSLLPLNHVALRLVAVRGTVRASQTQLRLEHRARVDHTRPSNGRRPTPRSCLAARGLCLHRVRPGHAWGTEMDVKRKRGWDDASRPAAPVACDLLPRRGQRAAGCSAVRVPCSGRCSFAVAGRWTSALAAER